MICQILLKTVSASFLILFRIILTYLNNVKERQEKTTNLPEATSLFVQYSNIRIIVVVVYLKPRSDKAVLIIAQEYYRIRIKKLLCRIVASRKQLQLLCGYSNIEQKETLILVD